MAYTLSLEVVLAISHSYVILPELFPHYLSLILIFRIIKGQWGRSNSRTILVNLYLEPCFHNLYISLKSIIRYI